MQIFVPDTMLMRSLFFFFPSILYVRTPLYADLTITSVNYDIVPAPSFSGSASPEKWAYKNSLQSPVSISNPSPPFLPNRHG